MVKESVCAGVAITPAYGAFGQKSALQLGLTVPKWTLPTFAPPVTIGLTVGIQFCLQRIVERSLEQLKPQKEGQKPELMQMFGSSALVAIVTAPFLAAFNKMTAGSGVFDSFRGLTFRQVGHIIGRETTFLASVRLINPLIERMRPFIGERNRAAEYGLAAASGVVGTIAGHGFDTALTRLQHGLNTSWRQLRLGAVKKSQGVAIFCIVYKALSDLST